MEKKKIIDFSNSKCNIADLNHITGGKGLYGTSGKNSVDSADSGVGEDGNGGCVQEFIEIYEDGS